MPAAALDGDCSVVATDSEVAAATGGPVTATPYPGDHMPDWTVLGLGGIRCAWAPESGSGVWVTVIPIAAVGQAVIDDAGSSEPYCYGSDSGFGPQDACSFSTAVGDWWFAGVVYAAIGSEVAASDATAALIADFSARAASHAATIPTRLDGTWNGVPDCDMLDERVDTTSTGLDLEATAGNQPGEAGPGFYGAVTASGQQTCFWEADGETVAETGILPGAWWVVDRQATLAGAEPVAAGSLRAVAVPDSDGSGSVTVYATDGVNLVTSRGTTGVDQLGALAGAVAVGATG